MDDEKNKSQAAPAAPPTPAAPATDCDLRPGECDEPDEGICEGERQARDFMAMALTDEAKRKARGWWIPELLSAIDCLRAERLAFLRRAELAESKLAQGTPPPAAPVTDAEIEAAIADYRRHVRTVAFIETSDEEPINEEAQELHSCSALRSLIARRVASAGAAPVDSEREAAIEAWRGVAMQDSMDEADNYDGFTPTKEDVGTPDELFALRREEIDEAVRLMRSAPPPPAGDQDAKLRELRARLLSTAASLPNRQMGHSDEDFDRGYVEACENWAQEIDRLLAAPAAPAGDQDAKLREAVEALETVATKQQKVEIRDAAHRILRGYSPCTNCGKWMHRSECHWPCNPIAPVAAPAASAIAAAPEAPKREPWEERWNEAETGSREELLALRDGLSSHARRIEALERAAQEGSK